MLDWLASVQIRKRTASRVELDLTRATAWTGWALVALGIWMVTLHALAILLAGVVVLGFGIRRRAAIPLFHLRAVVVAARRGGIYVAYVERRIGGTIHLDEARRPGPLLALAEAISEVAELRLVYDATTKIAAGD